jgi:hypothetical protein
MEILLPPAIDPGAPPGEDPERRRVYPFVPPLAVRVVVVVLTRGDMGDDPARDLGRGRAVGIALGESQPSTITKRRLPDDGDTG